jgi:hypothetical protein
MVQRHLRTLEPQVRGLLRRCGDKTGFPARIENTDAPGDHAL